MEVLLSFGPFKIYTLSVFVILGFLWAAFVISRRAVEYHLDKGKVFDLTVVGFIFGATTFKVLSLMWGQELGFWYFMAGVFLGVVTFALWNKPSESKGSWEIFEVLDIVSPGVAIGVAIVFLGLFASAGQWLDLASMSWYFVIFFCCYGLEYRYRFWGWYRAGRSSARAGLVFALWLIAMGMGRLWFEPYVASGVLVLGFVTVYLRSGRSLKKDLFSVLRRK